MEKEELAEKKQINLDVKEPDLGGITEVYLDEDGHWKEREKIL